MTICLRNCWTDDHSLFVDVMTCKDDEVFVVLNQIGSGVVCDFRMDFGMDTDDYGRLVKLMNAFKTSRRRHDGDLLLRANLVDFIDFVSMHASIEYFSDCCMDRCPFYSEMIVSSISSEKNQLDG